MGIRRRDALTLGASRLHTCGGGRIPTQRDVESERHAAALTLAARRFAAVVFARGGAVGDFCVGRAARPGGERRVVV
jgi:hypothetical protein